MKYFTDLRFRLLLIIALGLIPAYGVMVFATTQFRPLVQRQIYQDTLQHVDLIANRLEDLSDKLRQVLILASMDPEIHHPTHEQCNRILANISGTYFPILWSIGIADPEGNIICHLPVREKCINYNLSVHPFFTRTISSKEYTAGEFNVSPAGDTPVTGFGLPVLDHNGEIEEVLYSIVELRTLSDMLAETDLPQSAELMLLDRNNTILAHYPDHEIWVGRPFSDTGYMIHQSQMESVYIDLDNLGVERLFTYSPLKRMSRGEIKLISVVPTSAAFSQLNRIMGITGLISILATLLAMFVIWKLGNDLYERQMRSRIELTQRIVNGDINAEIETLGQPDHTKLITEFDQVIRILKKRELKRRQADEAIHSEIERVETLSSTLSRLTAQLDLRSLLEASCEVVIEALHISACSIRLYDPIRAAYIFCAHRGLSPQLTNNPKPLPEELCGHETNGSLFIWTRELLANTDLPDDLCEIGPDWTIASVKILHEDQVIGLLFLYAQDPLGRGSFDDRALIAGLADRIGISLANALLVDELRTEQKRRASLLQKVISAQEEERLRIARSLHDETSQSLSAINVYIDTASLFLEEQAVSEAINQMEKTKEVVNDLLGEIHRLIEDLRPSLLDNVGLMPAIAWYARQRLEPAGISLMIDEMENGLHLPAAVETELFRIAQEAITNIVRHSHATEVQISSGSDDEKICLSIYDNGVGFDMGMTKDLTENGFGLTGIYERVANLDGWIEIDSSPRGGTRISVCIPALQVESMA